MTVLLPSLAGFFNESSSFDTLMLHAYELLGAEVYLSESDAAIERDTRYDDNPHRLLNPMGLRCTTLNDNAQKN